MQSHEQYFRLKVDTSGRIVLPAELRSRYHIEEGDTVTLIENEGELKISTRAAAIARFQEYFAKLIPPGVSLVDELLEERRMEAELERRGS